VAARLLLLLLMRVVVGVYTMMKGVRLRAMEACYAFSVLLGEIDGGNSLMTQKKFVNEEGEI
jgi:hypothetical protein